MQTDVLTKCDDRATLNGNTASSSQHIIVLRSELEKEHSNLLERLHQLRRLLGYPALMTGKKRPESER